MDDGARFRLADHGKFFATRATARGIRERIEATPPGQLITLDFAGVAGMTVAFADELVGKLACGGWRVIIEGAADDAWESVRRVLVRRDLAPLAEVIRQDAGLEEPVVEPGLGGVADRDRR